jgi:uncharacterized protein HemX
VDLFTTGLDQLLASDVKLQWPSNLQTVMSLARTYERHQQEVFSVSSSSATMGAACD